MILAEATLFSTFSAQEEIAADSKIPPLERVRTYRSAGVWALSSAGYTSPCLETIPPLLLHLETEFVVGRSTPMKCYLLSSTCIRLMLRLGLHRDPSRLTNISAFEGEMRRRMWHFALQIEMLVSFHIGLPSIVQGIESDAELPRNLMDDDFDEGTAELPASRPDAENGPLTYFNVKTTLGRVFGQIARQTHLLTPMTDAEVTRLDSQLEDAWRNVPPFLKVRPLEECITDDPLLVMERFSIGSIYHNGQCVLHRRYLLSESDSADHGYSRRTCLRAALALLDFQKLNYEATRPGAMLAGFTWFLRPIIVGNFLLAAMIVYITLQCKVYPESTGDAPQLPQRPDLCRLLAQSARIWISMAKDDSSFRKPASILTRMAEKARIYLTDIGELETLETPEPMEELRPVEASLSNTQSPSSTTYGQEPYAMPILQAKAPAAVPPYFNMATQMPFTAPTAGFDLASLFSASGDVIDWVRRSIYVILYRKNE